jgi:hypothetical protein
MDAGGHLAVLGQPVQGVVDEDVRKPAARHAAVGVTARPHLGLRPRRGEGVYALPLRAVSLSEGVGAWIVQRSELSKGPPQ